MNFRKPTFHFYLSPGKGVSRWILESPLSTFTSHPFQTKHPNLENSAANTDRRRETYYLLQDYQGPYQVIFKKNESMMRRLEKQ